MATTRRATPGRRSTAAGRQRLERLMEERVAELGLTWLDVAKQTGHAVSGLRRIRREHDSTITPTLERSIERALGWKPRSVQKILGGGNPELLLTSPGRNKPVPPVDDLDIMRRWTQRLSRNDWWDLFEDMKIIRANAMRDGRTELLRELGLPDPRDPKPEPEHAGT